MSSVTSPPSSTTSCGPLSPGMRDGLRSVQSQYSSSVSPFQANTGMPASAMAAAAWSWVEKMLHQAQRTAAPRSTSVSISTAVWMVMCSEPVTRTPLSGLVGAYLCADGHQAGHFLLGDVDFLAAPVGEARCRRLCSRRWTWGRFAAELWPRGLLSWLERYCDT